MTAAKRMDGIARLQGAIENQMMHYPRAHKWSKRMLPECPKNLESECPDVSICLPQKKLANSGEMEKPVIFVERNFHGHQIVGFLKGKAI